MANNKTKSKNKNKKPYSKTDRRSNERTDSREKRDKRSTDKEADKYDDRTKGHNDISWYVSDPQILKDAASLSFFNPLGRKVSILPNLKINMAWEDYSADYIQAVNTVPGVMALGTMPVTGGSKDAASPLNTAVRAIYGFIRHANSGSKNYEASDLGMYLFAMDTVYALYANSVRIYGTLQMYSQANTYMPDTLLRAQGLEPESFRSNIADFRARLNIWISKVGTLFVPNVMSIYSRHAWMYSNYYLDDPTPKAQIMLYRLDGYYKYDPTYPNGGALRAMSFGLDKARASGGLMTMDTYMEILNGVVEDLIKDEDIGIMGGDILKAYGLGNLMQVSLIPESLAIEPLYNTEVLEQMQHATITGYFQTDDGYVMDGESGEGNTIRQENNVMLQQIVTVPMVYTENTDAIQYAALDTFAVSMDKLMNFDRPNIEPADVMVASRLMVGSSQTFSPQPVTVMADGISYNGYANVLEIDPCGSEIVTTVEIYSRVEDRDREVRELVTRFSNNILQTMGAYDFRRISLLSQFHWHPIMYFASSERIVDDEYMVTYNGVLTDLANYTVVTPQVLTRLHTSAIMAEFNVPRLGMST